jgi:hypothetical protein
MSDDSIDKLLQKVPATRRDVVKKLLAGAFAAPFVTAFALDTRGALAAASGMAQNMTSTI